MYFRSINTEILISEVAITLMLIFSAASALNIVAATMFKALAAENINIKVIATSEIKISVLIDRKYMELAVQALHDAFELEKAA